MRRQSARYSVAMGASSHVGLWSNRLTGPRHGHRGIVRVAANDPTPDQNQPNADDGPDRAGLSWLRGHDDIGSADASQSIPSSAF